MLRSLSCSVFAVVFVAGCGGPVDSEELESSTQASHAWGSYHWARTSNPFTVKLGDNLSSIWKSHLSGASSDWSRSSVLDTTVVAGRSTSTSCTTTAGRVEVCNARYGSTGWLGVASISVSGSHITRGRVRLNDTYFNTTRYNTSEWRRFVMCQEVGHTFGLAHQDENFNNTNLGSCMDYTNSPGTNQHPNSHDYSMLETIYRHLDSTTTVGQVAPGANAAAIEDWGRPLSSDLFVKELGRDEAIFTHVFWIEERAEHHR
jgi:hypothetical protein